MQTPQSAGPFRAPADSYYSAKSVLITGGRGYLGSCISTALAESGARLYLLDDSNSSWRPEIDKNVSLIRANVMQVDDYEEILDKVDIIFHLAALEFKRVDYSLLEDYLNNAKPAADIMAACVRRSVRPTIVFSSSSNIFGIQQSMPVSERSPDNPPSLWSAHKLVAEKYISYYSTKYGFKTLTLRLPNIFGTTRRRDTFGRSSINKMILDALWTGEISLYANANCRRDQILTDDASRAFLLAGLHARRWPDRSNFVLGCGVSHTYASIATMISEYVAELTGRSVSLKYNTDKYDDPIDRRDFVADFQEFSGLTGWTPGTTIADGLRQTIMFALNEGIRQ